MRRGRLTLEITIALGFLLPRFVSEVFADLQSLSGPYVAGHETTRLVDMSRDERELLTSIWYPVDPAEAFGKVSLQYYQHYRESGEEKFWWYDSPFLGGVSDAPASRGHFPIIALSHGNGGWPGSFQLLGEALASHGFVVVAPRHTGNAWGTTGVSASVYDRERPRDISFVIDQVIERSTGSHTDLLFDAVDPERIGVGGYSRGARTTLGLLSGQEAAGLSVHQDSRPQAAIFIDGSRSAINLGAGAASLDIPILSVAGGRISFSSYKSLDVPTMYGLDVSGADHWSFGTLNCQFLNKLEESGAPEAVMSTVGTEGWPGCAAEFTDATMVQLLQAQHAVAFFKQELAGDAGFASDLLPHVDEGVLDRQVNLTLRSDVPDMRADVSWELTSPDGNRLAIDADSGEVLNEIGEDVRVRSARRSVNISVPGTMVAAGEYQLTATLDNEDLHEASWDVSVEYSANRAGNSVSLRKKVVAGIPLQANEFLRQAFEIFPLNMPGDFDLSGLLDDRDIDLLSTAVRDDEGLFFDQNIDGILDQEDRRIWVEDVAATHFGDANLDGRVAFDDFLKLSDSYGANGGWSQGDFDGDGIVAFNDFLMLSSNYTDFQRAVASVPEPNNSLLILAGLVAGLMARNRIKLVAFCCVGVMCLCTANRQLLAAERVHFRSLGLLDGLLVEPIDLSRNGRFVTARTTEQPLQDGWWLRNRGVVWNVETGVASLLAEKSSNPSVAGDDGTSYGRYSNEEGASLAAYWEPPLNGIATAAKPMPMPVDYDPSSLGGPVVRDVSATGKVIGYLSYDEGETTAITWDSTKNTFEILNTPSGYEYSYPYGVSDDQTVIGRISDWDPCCDDMTVRWITGNTLETLTGLPPYGASNVSPDGSVIVGNSSNPDGLNAWLWRDGKITNIPQLRPIALPKGGLIDRLNLGVSAGGESLVGLHADFNVAARWTPSGGVQRIDELIRIAGDGDQIMDWRLDAAIDVSADGLRILGRGRNPDGHLDTWLLDLPRPGDTDGNGEVDFADFLSLSDLFGSTGVGLPADFNFDGSVTFQDFLILSANFGESATIAIVPEPYNPAPVLVSFALILLFRRRLRRPSPAQFN